MVAILASSLWVVGVCVDVFVSCCKSGFVACLIYGVKMMSLVFVLFFFSCLSLCLCELFVFRLVPLSYLSVYLFLALIFFRLFCWCADVEEIFRYTSPRTLQKLASDDDGRRGKKNPDKC